MKVICISKEEPNEDHPDLIISAALLEVGNTYTVIDTWRGMYELAEFPHPRQIVWKAQHFIPISSISETEMNRNYNMEKV